MRSRLSHRIRTLFLASVALTATMGIGAAADFKFAGPLDAYTLDPHAVSNTLIFAVLGNVYEPLVRRGKDLALEPALATSWTQTDKTHWEFKLRQGVTFQNGDAFTADDVVFSLERAKKGGTKGNLSAIASAEKIDDFTVRFTTSTPDPVLPNQIVNFFIMSKKWAEANNAVQPGTADNTTETYANRHANGTGPYAIVARDPNVKTVFKANTGWWDKLDGNVDSATFFVIPNASTRVSALISGEVDMIDAVPPQDADRVGKTKGLSVQAGKDLRVAYLQPDVVRDSLIFGSETDKNPFKDLKVRRAMQLAIDTKVIQQRIMGGYSTPTGLPVAPEVNGATPELERPVVADLDKAKALMKEAGYEKGFSVTLDCTNDRFMNDEATCIAIAAMLGRIGIKVEPRVQATALWAKQINPPGYNTSFMMAGYSPFTYDAGLFLDVIVHTRVPKTGGGAFNIGGFSNPKLDALSDQINEETDQAKRTDLLHQALQILKDEVAVIPIHQLATLWGVKTNVKVVQTPDFTYPLRYFQVK